MAIQRAYAAYEAGDLHAASQWADMALIGAPKDTQVLLVYGIIKQAKADYAAAATAFRSLTRLQPTEPTHWMNLATALRASGQLDEAAEGYRAAARIAGWSPVLRYNLALLEIERGQLPQARQHLALAMVQRPVDAEIGCLYAQTLMHSGEPAALRSALQDWQSWQGWTPELLAEVAMMLLTAGDQASALGIVEQLAMSRSNAPAVEMTLISLLERTNRLDEANQRFSRLRTVRASIPPELTARWLGLSAQLANRNGQTQDAVALYQELLAKDVPEPERHELLFPLAKALDTLGRSDEAFEAATAAHRSQMAFFGMATPGSSDLEIVFGDPRTIGCDPEDVARWHDPAAPSADQSPVFIVAFPRSGTTLLEQMMDAHPGLQTMDEQRFLLDAQECLQEQGLDYPRALAQATAEQLQAARQRYWHQVATKVDLAPGQRLLDKNPLNMLRLPVIRRLWPEAPIIMAVRHPLDVITSNYFQHYRAPDFARLCQDLPTLAAGYTAMFTQWYAAVETLQPRVLEIRYESLVADLEGYARQIAQFCDLPWDAAMLEPAQNARRRGYIGTPSYHQVVKPVTTKAVGRWRAYEPQMRGLVPGLSGLLARWGYEA
ncbi:sulfotransferase [Ideonella sp. 4Y11]|uniref:Sulfotransferase n=1 Tax=Ideonella aquatica TaxID=2824119 RepID=A0A940YK17_9BURK|nr:tetratricopeptide repeat-containing sulfotransferase family protein [Ideonella aquatica]MBQ0959466.1 sulfotransferase [Ideonella aquatica]